MSDIFISYANEDRDRVRELIPEFEAKKLTVWWDRSIPAGRSYRDVIEDAIRSAKCVVVVWSKHSIVSKWVQEEADEGMRRDILVPLLLDDVMPPLGFRSIQAADLTHWNGDSDDPVIDRLFTDIANVLDVSKSQLPPAQPAAPSRESAPTETPGMELKRGNGVHSRARSLPFGKLNAKTISIALASLLVVIWVLFKLDGTQTMRTNPGITGTPGVQEPVSDTTSPGAPTGLPSIVRAEPPPAEYFVLPAIGRQPDTRLRLLNLSEKPNQITDNEDWRVANGLDPLTYTVPNPFRQQTGDLPPYVPTTLNNLRVVNVIRGNPVIAIYGENYSEGRYLLAIDPTSGRSLFAFDFSLYEWPPSFDRQEKEYVKMATSWAQVEGKILYVAHTHRTYASSSKGNNAYLTAIDIPSNRILWRSQPLVCNTSNFVVKDGAIITGYGFTKERDFLYVLNKADGRVVQQVTLKSGPEQLVEKDDRLFVRAYDTDYVFQFGNDGGT